MIKIASTTLNFIVKIANVNNSRSATLCRFVNFLCFSGMVCLSKNIFNMMKADNMYNYLLCTQCRNIFLEIKTNNKYVLKLSTNTTINDNEMRFTILLSSNEISNIYKMCF